MVLIGISLIICTSFVWIQRTNAHPFIPENVILPEVALFSEDLPQNLKIHNIAQSYLNTDEQKSNNQPLAQATKFLNYDVTADSNVIPANEEHSTFGRPPYVPYDPYRPPRPPHRPPYQPPYQPPYEPPHEPGTPLKPIPIPANYPVPVPPDVELIPPVSTNTRPTTIQFTWHEPHTRVLLALDSSALESMKRNHVGSMKSLASNKINDYVLQKGEDHVCSCTVKAQQASTQNNFTLVAELSEDTGYLQLNSSSQHDSNTTESENTGFGALSLFLSDFSQWNLYHENEVIGHCICYMNSPTLKTMHERISKSKKVDEYESVTIWLGEGAVISYVANYLKDPTDIGFDTSYVEGLIVDGSEINKNYNLMNHLDDTTYSAILSGSADLDITNSNHPNISYSDILHSTTIIKNDITHGSLVNISEVSPSAVNLNKVLKTDTPDAIHADSSSVTMTSILNSTSGTIGYLLTTQNIFAVNESLSLQKDEDQNFPETMTIEKERNNSTDNLDLQVTHLTEDGSVPIHNHMETQVTKVGEANNSAFPSLAVQSTNEGTDSMKTIVRIPKIESVADNGEQVQFQNWPSIDTSSQTPSEMIIKTKIDSTNMMRTTMSVSPATQTDYKSEQDDLHSEDERGDLKSQDDDNQVSINSKDGSTVTPNTDSPNIELLSFVSMNDTSTVFPEDDVTKVEPNFLPELNAPLSSRAREGSHGISDQNNLNKELLNFVFVSSKTGPISSDGNLLPVNNIGSIVKENLLGEIYDIDESDNSAAKCHHPLHNHHFRPRPIPISQPIPLHIQPPSPTIILAQSFENSVSYDEMHANPWFNLQQGISQVQQVVPAPLAVSVGLPLYNYETGIGAPYLQLSEEPVYDRNAPVFPYNTLEDMDKFTVQL